jgi:hypothetical protein
VQLARTAALPEFHTQGNPHSSDVFFSLHEGAAHVPNLHSSDLHSDINDINLHAFPPRPHFIPSSVSMTLH